jgi:hypothetical protein
MSEVDVSSSADTQVTWTPPQSETEQSSWEGRIWSEGEPTPDRLKQTVGATPSAVKEIALSTGKGLGRIVGAPLKAPMVFTHGVTRGFHNLPKLYGGEVREYENVTDLKSGLIVSGKVFDFLARGENVV